MTDVLEQWRKAIGDSEAECYWPGPRPIDEDDRLDQLHGRDQVVKDFARDVREHRVVVFSGASGVGKSSVLNRGIRPYLRNQGFTVMACNRWGDAGGDVDDIDAFMRTKLIGVPKGLDSERPLVDQLHERFGSRAVIVLDQFEELIRHEPKISRAVTDWIEDAVLDTDIRIVVSLREEYTPRLRGLRVGPWQRRDFSLEPISDIETIGEIVREGHRTDAAAGVPDVVIEEPAVQQLQRLWAAAEGGTDASDIGLLHLQAMLYILWRRTRSGSPDGIIRAEDLSRFVTARDEDSDAGQGADAARRVFRRALAGVVSLRLELCEDVYLRHPLGDRTVATGVRTMIRRAATYLASGGYKVDQDRWHLAELVLESEMETLGFADRAGRERSRELFAALAEYADRGTGGQASSSDYLGARRAEFLLGTPDADGESSGTAWPWESDPHDVSAGMMMGARPWEVLVEEFRRFLFAIDWLDASYLVRQTVRSAETTVSLIHDGFGAGLANWARTDDADEFEENFALLTAAVGKVFTSQHPASGRREDGTVSPIGLSVNLRWRSCFIREVAFSDITFVNCDFRNSIFSECTFDGVVFVNCLLDGVRFERCRFNNGVSGDDESYEMPVATDASRQGAQTAFELPPFYLSDVEFAGGSGAVSSVVQSLSRYRERPVESDELYSQTSGIPVRARRNETAYPVAPAAGGVAMYGGRLSSLVFTRCAFPNTGQVALRHVAGTSLELAEQATGRFELFDVAIRGLTVSGVIGQPAGGTLTMQAQGSILQNVWISSSIAGELILDDCRVWQLANASESMTVTVPERDDGDESSRIVGVLGESERPELATWALKVDYRSNPAKYEIEKHRL